MNINFSQVLAQLGPNASFRISNQRRPDQRYIWNTFLPERNRMEYAARSGTMTVRSTMAGLVGMDSPYPPTGVASASTFLEETCKVAGEVTFPEAQLRDLQLFLNQLAAQQAIGIGFDPNVGDANQVMVNTVFNFIDKLIVQPHLDTAEYLRSEAMVFGAINWTFNQKTLAVDYGFPAANMLPTRTAAAHTAYFDTATTFWPDIRLARSLLYQQVRAVIANPLTIDAIVSNPANNLFVTAQDVLTGQMTVRRIRNLTTGQLSEDVRDQITLIPYPDSGEILDLANPGKTIRVPFCPAGKIVFVGDPVADGFRIPTQGGTIDPNLELPIGYTHIAPTVEGNGVSGRWSRVFTPESMPMQLKGQGVTNLLPVIENPNLVVVLTTEMPT